MWLSAIYLVCTTVLVVYIHVCLLAVSYHFRAHLSVLLAHGCVIKTSLPDFVSTIVKVWVLVMPELIRINKWNDKKMTANYGPSKYTQNNKKSVIIRQSHHQSNSEKTSDNLQKPVPLEGNNETSAHSNILLLIFRWALSKMMPEEIETLTHKIEFIDIRE